MFTVHSVYKGGARCIDVPFDNLASAASFAHALFYAEPGNLHEVQVWSEGRVVEHVSTA